MLQLVILEDSETHGEFRLDESRGLKRNKIATVRIYIPGDGDTFQGVFRVLVGMMERQSNAVILERSAFPHVSEMWATPWALHPIISPCRTEAQRLSGLPDDQQ
jgi:hypothetical protein